MEKRQLHLNIDLSLRRAQTVIQTHPLHVLLIPLTPEPSRPLYDLVNFLERVHELLVVVGADLVAGDEVPVDVVQLGVPLPHTLPV